MISKEKLVSDKVILDPFKSSNVTEKYLSWMKDKNINQYILKSHDNLILKDLKTFVDDLDKSKNDIFFRIIDKKQQLHIGNIRLGPINFENQYTKFGILIGEKNFQKKGYARESIRLVIDYSFNNLKLKIFKFECVSENVPAMKLYQNMGFKMEKIPEKFIKNNKALDQVMWYRENKFL